MEDPHTQATRAARSAMRWANVSVWLSGCALVLWAVPVLAAIAVAVWVYLATR